MSVNESGDKNLRVLIVGSEPSLEKEFRTALQGVADSHGVFYYADTYRQALDVARGRQPNLVVVDIDREVAEVAALTKDLHELAPGSAIVCAYKQEKFEEAASESRLIIELLRSNVNDFLRQPFSATELREVLDRVMARPVVAPPDERGRVLSFMSNKGGVGKSTLAVNVATALALRHPDEVLLIDAAMQGGSCAMMLDLKPTTSLVDAVRERDRLDPTLLRNITLKHGTGLRLLASPADALEGAEIDDEATSRILHLARRSFRFVIIDMFPILDNIVTTSLDLTDVAYVVVQGLAPAIAAAARFLPVLDGLGVPAARQRLVLAQTYKSFLGNLRPDDVAGRLGRSMDYVVPYDARIPASMNTGSPQILHANWWHPFGRVINQMVDDISGTPLAAEPAENAGRAAAKAGR